MLHNGKMNGIAASSTHFNFWTLLLFWAMQLICFSRVTPIWKTLQLFIIFFFFFLWHQGTDNLPSLRLHKLCKVSSKSQTFVCSWRLNWPLTEYYLPTAAIVICSSSLPFTKFCVCGKQSQFMTAPLTDSSPDIIKTLARRWSRTYVERRGASNKS